MMNTYRTYLFPDIWVAPATVFLVASVLFLSAGSVQAKSLCYDNWSEAAVVVEKNKLVKVAALDEMVQKKLNGRIVKTTLCTKDKGYEYKIVVRKTGGQLTGVSVDAKAPFAK